MNTPEGLSRKKIKKLRTILHQEKGTWLQWYGHGLDLRGQTQNRPMFAKKTVKTKKRCTTNIFQHIKQKHLAEQEQCVRHRLKSTDASSMNKTPKTQQSVAAVFSRAMPYDKSGQRWKDIMTAVAFHIGKDTLHIYSVENPGFKKLLKTLDPKYEPPSQNILQMLHCPVCTMNCSAHASFLVKITSAIAVLPIQLNAEVLASNKRWNIWIIFDCFFTQKKID